MSNLTGRTRLRPMVMGGVIMDPRILLVLQVEYRTVDFPTPGWRDARIEDLVEIAPGSTRTLELPQGA